MLEFVAARYQQEKGLSDGCYENPRGRIWSVNRRQFVLLRLLEREGGWRAMRWLEEKVALESGDQLLHHDVLELVKNGLL